MSKMEGTDCQKYIFFFFSQTGVFLARLFSIGPQKTILRLLRGTVITDCCCENPEKTDSESGNWKKDVFNYRKQWKQFPTWQTTSDFADRAFPPVSCQISLLERFIHPQIICQPNVMHIYLYSRHSHRKNENSGMFREIERNSVHNCWLLQESLPKQGVVSKPSVEGGVEAAPNFPSCHYHNNWALQHTGNRLH